MRIIYDRPRDYDSIARYYAVGGSEHLRSIGRRKAEQHRQQRVAQAKALGVGPFRLWLRLFADRIAGRV